MLSDAYWIQAVVHMHNNGKPYRNNRLIDNEKPYRGNRLTITAEKNIGDNRYFDKTIIAEKSIGGENR